MRFGKIASILAACTMVVLLATYKSHQSISIVGKYVSVDDLGVLQFRDDGTFGYLFPTNITFFSADASVPSVGFYEVTDGNEVKLSGLPALEPKFTIQRRGQGESLLLTRIEPNGNLPKTAVYQRQ
jgi:hypothetical protein